VIMRILRHADQAVTMEISQMPARLPHARHCGDLETSWTEMSSSGTRLTKEFRYLLDMINMVFPVGWFRAAAICAGLRGRGQGSAGRPTAQRLGLDAGPGRRILSLAGPPIRGGERAMLFGPVVPDRMDPHDLAVAGELD
jgi:hypothetical protein